MPPVDFEVLDKECDESSCAPSETLGVPGAASVSGNCTRPLQVEADMNARCRLLALVTLSFLMTSGARGCPPYPYMVDLWAALEPADAVVVAEVVSSRPTARVRAALAARSWLESTSDAVGELWYDGGLLLDEALSRFDEPRLEFDVVVHAEDELIGQVPARLTLRLADGYFDPRVGERRVVLFLALRNGRWILPDGAQSILPLPTAQLVAPEVVAEVLDDLRAAVRAGKEILEADQVSPEAVRDWLVLATAMRGTRPYTMHRLQRDRRALTNAQHATLAEAFLAESPSPMELRRWIDLIGDSRDPAVFAHAAEAIEVLRQQPSSGWHWLAEDLLVRLGAWTEDGSARSAEGRANLEARWTEVLSGQ